MYLWYKTWGLNWRDSILLLFFFFVINESGVRCTWSDPTSLPPPILRCSPTEWTPPPIYLYYKNFHDHLVAVLLHYPVLISVAAGSYSSWRRTRLLFFLWIPPKPGQGQPPVKRWGPQLGTIITYSDWSWARHCYNQFSSSHRWVNRRPLLPP